MCRQQINVIERRNTKRRRKGQKEVKDKIKNKRLTEQRETQNLDGDCERKPLLWKLCLDLDAL